MRHFLLIAWIAATAPALLAPNAAARTPSATGTRTGGPNRAPAIIDNTARMDANDLDMVVTNHGSFAYDLMTGNAGLVYPKGTTHTVVFAGGLWIAGTVNGEIRDAVGEYSQEFTPGPMAGGTFQTDRPEFKTYRIERGGAGYAYYLANAVPQGAPVDAQGQPLLYGDVTLWNVFNDADPGAHTNQAGSTSPIGLEVKQTVFAFNRTGAIGRTIYFIWRLENKGSNLLENAYAALWSDPDLGGFTDDLVGCDTTLALGYCYNATNADAQYGSSPPAVGFTLLQGPLVDRGGGVTDTLGLTAFVQYINGTDPSSYLDTYNYIRGLHADGTPIHFFDDPFQPVTTYMVSGDPVSGTGWLDTGPSDHRMSLCSGPFTLAPGAVQVIVAAVVVGQGADRLSSISALRSATAEARSFDIGPISSVSISVPAGVSVDEGQTLSFGVTSRDPSGVATLTAAGLPLGATFQDYGDGSGQFQWTPGFDQSGAYTVTFTAHGTDGSGASGSTVVNVRDVNRKPAANPGGPYVSYRDTPVQFDGTGSADPDGNPLTYSWNFGDDEIGTGPTPAHLYAFLGTYGVALTVSDGRLTDVATTTAEIVDRYTARAFTAAGNQSIRLNAGKPQWCVQIEPVGSSFEVTSVDLSTVVMRSAGTGIVSEIHAIAGKGATIADRDGNGVAELAVCFAKADLRALFANVQGNQSIPVTFVGSVTTGGEFTAALTVAVIASGGSLAASFEPNPVSRSGGTLAFVTEQSGRARVALFDPAGRLVRRVWETAGVEPGLHRIAVEPRDASGRPLASGVYFYRIETAEGVATGRVLVLR